MNIFGWRITRVKGQSMIPVLSDGDFVFGRRPKQDPIPKGQIVLVEHPEFGPIIKCVGDKLANGYELYGLSVFSTSKQRLGVVKAETIVAEFTWRIAPDAITRLKRHAEP